MTLILKRGATSGPTLTTNTYLVDLAHPGLQSIFPNVIVEHQYSNYATQATGSITFGQVYEEGRRFLLSSYNTISQVWDSSTDIQFAWELSTATSIVRWRRNLAGGSGGRFCIQAVKWDEPPTAAESFDRMSTMLPSGTSTSAQLFTGNPTTSASFLSYYSRSANNGLDASGLAYSSLSPTNVIARRSPIARDIELDVRLFALDFNNASVTVEEKCTSVDENSVSRVDSSPLAKSDASFIIPRGQAYFGWTDTNLTSRAQMAFSASVQFENIIVQRSVDGVSGEFCFSVVHLGALEPTQQLTTSTATTTAVSSTMSTTSMASTTAPATTVGAGQTASSASYQGDLNMQTSSTLVVTAGVTTTIGGSLNIDSGATLSLTNVDSGSRKRMGVNRTFVAVSAASVQGTFATVIASPSDACQTAEVMETTYSPTAVSVLVQVSGDPCASSGGGGLSTGAIIGIAVGAAVGGVLVILLIVILFKCHRRRLTRSMQEDIMKVELDTKY